MSRSPEIIGEWRRGGVDVVGARVGAPPASAPATATRTRTRTPPPRWERGRATRRSPGTPRGARRSIVDEEVPDAVAGRVGARVAARSTPRSGAAEVVVVADADEKPRETLGKRRRAAGVHLPGFQNRRRGRGARSKFHENPLWDEAVGDVDGAVLAAARSPSPRSKTKPTATRDSSASFRPGRERFVRVVVAVRSWERFVRVVVAVRSWARGVHRVDGARDRESGAAGRHPRFARGDGEVRAAAATSPTIRRRLGASRRCPIRRRLDAATAAFRERAIRRRSAFDAATRAAAVAATATERGARAYLRLGRVSIAAAVAVGGYGGGGALDRALVGASTLRVARPRPSFAAAVDSVAANRTDSTAPRPAGTNPWSSSTAKRTSGSCCSSAWRRLRRNSRAPRRRFAPGTRLANDHRTMTTEWCCWRHVNAVLVVESETSGENAVAAEERAAEERASVVSDDVSDASSAPSTVPEASTSDVDPEDFATPLASLDVSFETTRADARSDGIPEATIFETTNLEASADASFESATSATEATIAAAEATVATRRHARSRRRDARSRRERRAAAAMDSAARAAKEDDDGAERGAGVLRDEIDRLTRDAALAREAHREDIERVEKTLIEPSAPRARRSHRATRRGDVPGRVAARGTAPSSRRNFARRSRRSNPRRPHRRKRFVARSRTSRGRAVASKTPLARARARRSAEEREAAETSPDGAGARRATGGGARGGARGGTRAAEAVPSRSRRLVRGARGSPRRGVGGERDGDRGITSRW